MVPIRLQLKNFMSYGEQVPPLEFSGIRFACLSGDNGNGKSALLDAMTWTLFGRTRARSEDDVIRRGATDCQVVFDFEIESVRYRIDRRRTRRGASWELQVRQEDGTFRPLTGAGARETETRIRELLRMDYEMFLASGYVAQGRADEFTRITPAKRKEILADILNIGFYERLEKMAKERHDEARDRETDAEREINGLNAQIARRPLIEQHLAENERIRATTSLRLQTVRTDYETRRGVLHALRERESRAKQLQERITDETRYNRNDQELLTDLEDRIGRAESILARREEILRQYEDYIALNDRAARLEEEYREFRAFERQAAEHEKRIREAERELDRERYAVRCELDLLEQEAEFIARMDTEIARFDREIHGFGDLDRRFGELEERQKATEQEFNELKEENGAVKGEQALFRQRLDALTASSSATCEYCGQPLPPARRQEAIIETRTRLEQLEDRLRDLKNRGGEAKRVSDLIRGELRQLRDDQTVVTRLSTQRTQALQEHLRLTERATQLPNLRTRHETLDRRLREKDYATEEFEALTRVTAQMERLERVEQQLQDVRKAINDCGDIERQRLLLESAEKDLLVYPSQRDEVRQRIDVRSGKIEKARQQVVTILQQVADLPILEQECEALAVDLQTAENEVRNADRDIAVCQQELSRLDDMERERGVRETERKAAARDRDLYKELVGAFGKKGIQQLIIERALPQIEEEANLILGRMTNHAMKVQLRSTREGKSKTTGTMETLDILISDDLGERPYEMYSGGEAFRVNFALRIALSKVLAHRAGAPLRTLILDEGFGTQDPRGREAIVDALNSVQDQFELILVITHIEELKDAFPTRIEVVKGPDGSTFTVQ
ncbi:MAG: SMC family ATPase [Capsulimonadales bacterium]|nr:SMC family ATPase [Capsulimonadales bacterium]